MSGYHDRADASDDDLRRLDEVRARGWNGYVYADRLPRLGLTADGVPALTGIRPADVGRYVVLTVRDPLAGEGTSHAQRIAEQFGTAAPAGASSLFDAWTAPLGEDRVTVVSTGSGAPELELVLVELMQHTPADVLVYFGTAAGLHPYVHPGDVVVSTGIVREEAMTKAYIDASFPAAPHHEVVGAMLRAAEDGGVRALAGVTRSTDSDILGNGRPSVGGYLPPTARGAIDYWVSAGVLCNDREASAVVVLGSLFGRRTGAVLAVTDNYPQQRPLVIGAGVGEATTVLRDGLRSLERRDRSRPRARERGWRADA